MCNYQQPIWLVNPPECGCIYGHTLCYESKEAVRPDYEDFSDYWGSLSWTGMITEGWKMQSLIASEMLSAVCDFGWFQVSLRSCWYQVEVELNIFLCMILTRNRMKMS